MKTLGIYKYNQFMSSIDINNIKWCLIIYVRNRQTSGLKKVGVHFFQFFLLNSKYTLIMKKH